MARPRVLINCAVSRNGCLAEADGSAVAFSGDEDWARVHALRAECDGILVGANTVRNDDPSLLSKQDGAEQPLRVVLSSDGELPPGARIFNQAAPTVVVTGPKAPPVFRAQQIRVPLADGQIDVGGALDALGAMGLQSILVEGGAQTIRSFLAADAWHELTVYVADMTIDADAPRIWSNGPDELGLPWVEEPLGEGRLLRFSRA